MNDQASPPSVPPLMNDDAARTPTGEILDQSTPPIPPPTEPTPPINEDLAAKPPATEAKPSDLAKPPPGAPETYAAFKAPDNYTLSEKLVAEAIPLFKELN